MLAPQMMSEKMRMNEMVASSRACVPFPVSPRTCERSTAIRKLMTAAVILVPKVLTIFLNIPLAWFLSHVNDFNIRMGFLVKGEETVFQVLVELDVGDV